LPLAVIFRAFGAGICLALSTPLALPTAWLGLASKYFSFTPGFSPVERHHGFKETVLTVSAGYSIAVEALPTLATEQAGIDHLLQQRTRSVFTVVKAFV
jgi:hypothetical protein